MEGEEGGGNGFQLCPSCKEIFGATEEELQNIVSPKPPSGLKLAENGVEEVPPADPPVQVSGTEGMSSKDGACSELGEDNVEPTPKRLKLSPASSVSHDLACPAPSVSHDHSCCPEVHCVACFGLLEQSYVQHLANVITDQVEQTGLVGMESYHLSIHVPLSLRIRRMGMEMCVRKSKNSNTTSEHLSEPNYVKERLRWQLIKLLDRTLSPLKSNIDSPFMINLSLDHKASLRDCIGLKKQHPKLFPRPKKRRNQPSQPVPITNVPIQRALEVVTEAGMVKENYFLSHVRVPCTHEVELQHRSMFVAGRYNKYSRHLPQTPWLVDGARKADSSVQELICPLIVEAFRASEVRFSSSGREDVDVLMLGSGRPFLLELVNPRNVSITNTDLQGIEKAVNDGTELIAVKNLQRVSKSSSSILKEGEESKKKIYSALVWTREPLNEERLKVLRETRDLVIGQKTPIRVLHRRTLAVREKVIYSMEPESLEDAHHFKLRLVTQAGTYIKEFVHGDFGRTQPNVGTLLECEADILSLDVLEVQLQWPPTE